MAKLEANIKINRIDEEIEKVKELVNLLEIANQTIQSLKQIEIKLQS